jgi:hypothetical protein
LQVNAHLWERDSNNNGEIRYGNIAACKPVVPFQLGKLVCIGPLSSSDGRLQHRRENKFIF